jgi:DUF1009 family protein
MKNKLAIIAGSGNLPLMLAQNHSGEVHVICIKDEANPELYEDYPKIILPLGKIQSLLEYLDNHEIKNLVIVGKVKYRDLRTINPDFQGAILLAKIIKNKFLGDDQILNTIAQYLTTKGYKLHSPQEILLQQQAQFDDLNNHSQDFHNLTDQDLSDIGFGFEAAKMLGRFDIGQALIVEHGKIIGVEALEGTDALIKRCASLRVQESPSGILVKVIKPNQNQTMDIPAVGPDTIQCLSDNNYKGLAIEHKQVVIINPTEVFALAQTLGIFIHQIKL